MRAIPIVLSLTLAVTCAYADTTDWSKAAGEDLIAIHQYIIDNSPATYLPETNNFKNWFDPGYKIALGKVGLVHSYNDYVDLLTYYVNGLHTPHIYLSFLKQPKPTSVKWPGFVIRWDGRAFKVAYSNNAANTPPKDAVLIGCDGINADRLFMRNVAPFMYPDPHYKIYWTAEAPNLFIDRANPLVTMPKQCEFAYVQQRLTYRKSYTLDWQSYSGTVADLLSKTSQAASNLKTPQSFSITQFGKNSMWVSLPSFEGHTDQLGQIAKSIAQYRNADVIVFDLRGNGGGSFADAVLSIIALFDGNYLATLGHKFDLNNPVVMIWRVSTANIDFLNKMGGTPTAAQLQGGKDKNQAIIMTSDAPYNSAMSSALIRENPVKAKVVLLTDADCYSACWMLVRALREIPHVTQVGQGTGIMDKYTNPITITIRPNIVELSVAMSAFKQPAAHLGKPFFPDIPYDGNMADTQSLQNWIINLYESDKLK